MTFNVVLFQFLLGLGRGSERPPIVHLIYLLSLDWNEVRNRVVDRSFIVERSSFKVSALQLQASSSQSQAAAAWTGRFLLHWDWKKRPLGIWRDLPARTQMNQKWMLTGNITRMLHYRTRVRVRVANTVECSHISMRLWPWNIPRAQCKSWCMMHYPLSIKRGINRS